MAKQECDCIFCNFKCPECGSEEIEITYSPVFTCWNDTEDCILVERETDKLELQCDDCGAWLEYSDHSKASEKLEVSRKVLSERLRIPTTTYFKHKDNGEITSMQVTYVSKERGE